MIGLPGGLEITGFDPRHDGQQLSGIASAIVRPAQGDLGGEAEVRVGERRHCFGGFFRSGRGRSLRPGRGGCGSSKVRKERRSIMIYVLSIAYAGGGWEVRARMRGSSPVRGLPSRFYALDFRNGS